MKLTRKLVLARAKASELDSVKKLNCWGCNLTDISIFNEIPNIEVLTLSANRITSLQPILHCHHLAELYLRKNQIENIAEVHHLKALSHLRVLWLAENPCCGEDLHKYRMTVLRNLPGLQKLDNQAVTEEELAQALEEGEEIAEPPVSCAPEKPEESVSNGDHVQKERPAEAETDPLHFSMEETNKIREELGMKPLSREKFPSITSPRETGSVTKKQNHILQAVLLLLKELDYEDLQVVQKTTEGLLEPTCTREASQQTAQILEQ
ncbi:cilia and flagella associated protein 410 [Polypterus senegalus]